MQLTLVVGLLFPHEIKPRHCKAVAAHLYGLRLINYRAK